MEQNDTVDSILSLVWKFLLGCLFPERAVGKEDNANAVMIVTIMVLCV